MRGFYQTFVAGCFVLCGAGAQAAPVTFEFVFSGPNGGIFVDEVAQSAASGFSFLVTVDTTTPDTLPSDASYGEFIASEVLYTSVDLGYDKALVSSSLAYFEDNDPGFTRLGIADANASSGLSLFPTDPSVIGDPNAIDTLPNFVTTEANSRGATVPGSGFGFLLTDGTEIRFGSIDLASASIAPVPLPAGGLLLLSGVMGLGWYRRRKAI